VDVGERPAEAGRVSLDAYLVERAISVSFDYDHPPAEPVLRPSIPRCLLAGVVGITLVGAWAGCGASKNHQSRSSTALVTASPEEPPTTAEVEEDARQERGQREQARLLLCHRQHSKCPPPERPSHVSCRELEGHHWSCLLRFPDGEIVLMHAVWYGAQRALGKSVVARSPLGAAPLRRLKGR
jgi:hypothetical protein